MNVSKIHKCNHMLVDVLKFIQTMHTSLVHFGVFNYNFVLHMLVLYGRTSVVMCTRFCRRTSEWRNSDLMACILLIMWQWKTTFLQMLFQSWRVHSASGGGLSSIFPHKTLEKVPYLFKNNWFRWKCNVPAHARFRLQCITLYFLFRRQLSYVSKFFTQS